MYNYTSHIQEINLQNYRTNQGETFDSQLHYAYDPGAGALAPGWNRR
jgi:hypothetical protein